MTMESHERPKDALHTEARIVKLEVNVEYLQRDVAALKEGARPAQYSNLRFALSGMAIMFIGLAAVLARGFGWL